VRGAGGLAAPELPEADPGADPAAGPGAGAAEVGLGGAPPEAPPGFGGIAAVVPAAPVSGGLAVPASGLGPPGGTGACPLPAVAFCVTVPGGASFLLQLSRVMTAARIAPANEIQTSRTLLSRTGGRPSGPTSLTEASYDKR
jgi:hypothetical protein